MSWILLVVWACREPSTSELLLRAEETRSVGDEGSAEPLYRELCEARDVAEACAQIGLWERGCDLGSREACRGGMERTMGEVWMDFALAACALGDGDSCWLAGWEADADPHAPGASSVIALEAFEGGCVAEHALSCLAAGDRHRDALRFPDAVERYRRACAEPEDVGCDLAAHTEALAAQVASCAAGEVSACQAACPQVTDDAVCAQAVAATAAACDQRDAEACTLLGHIYGAGRGVPADLDRANALLWLACDLDDAVACLRLEDNLSQRRGASPAGSRGIPWLRVQVCDLQMDYGCAPHRFWR